MNDGNAYSYKYIVCEVDETQTVHINADEDISTLSQVDQI